jgi:hypothetical protein
MRRYESLSALATSTKAVLVAFVPQSRHAWNFFGRYYDFS